MDRRGGNQRRLDLARAIGDGARALPRLWAGAWASLVFVTLLALASPWAPAPGRWVYLVALGLSVLSLWGGLSRLGVSDDVGSARRLGLGAGGLQFGAAEFRIAFAAFLNLLFLSMIGVVLGLVALALAGIAELDVAAIQARDWLAVGPAWKLVMLAFVGLIAAGVPLLLVVRLALFSQATVGRRHTVSLNTMGVAHGSFWPLLGLLLIAAAPVLLLAASAAGGVPAACLIVMAVLVWIQAPWAAALMGAAYRQLEYWKPGGAA